jgi:cysteine desulfuration protein SufE
MRRVTAIDEILETFELLDDWEERYRYVIDLGRQLPAMPAGDKTEENRVTGCTSRVWLVPELSPGTAQKMILRGDSDAHIVRGLVAILLSLYSGKTPAEILKIDARAFLDKLGLEAHLSPSRASGLVSMVDRIRALAAEKQAA